MVRIADCDSADVSSNLTFHPFKPELRIYAMKCKHCNLEIDGDYVEVWSMAFPAHSTGYLHIGCAKEQDKLRKTAIFILSVVCVCLLVAMKYA